ncbi:uncharacterized protein LOC144461819, partial [Epinephelus lanceolatus]
SSSSSSSCPVPSSQPSSFSASHSQSSLWSQDTPELFRPSFRVGRSGIEQIPCSAAELHILKLLEHMKHQLTQLIAMVNLIPGRMVDECPTEVPEGIQFPFGSLEEVENFEEWLKEPRNSSQKKNLISVLGSIGGQDTKRVTWNILSHMFCDSVAKKISWKGANGKMAFRQMAIKAVLARAVRKSHVAKQASDMDINKHVIRWFNLASDRGGGRRDRMMRTQVTLEATDILMSLLLLPLLMFVTAL